MTPMETPIEYTYMYLCNTYKYLQYTGIRNAGTRNTGVYAIQLILLFENIVFGDVVITKQWHVC